MRRDIAAEIKAALRDPRAFAADLGLEVSKDRKQAGGIFALCPAGHDRGASLSLRSMRDGIAAHCFGCGLDGSVLDVIASAHGLDIDCDFRAVVEEGLSLAGLDPLEESRRPSSTGPRRPSSTDPRRPVAAAAPTPAAPEALDPDIFAALAAEILERAPLAGYVERYLDRRNVLEAARADGWGALPSSPAEQFRIAAEILDRFGPVLLARSGLFKVEKTQAGDLVIVDGAPVLCSPVAFLWSAHVLVIPWRAVGVDGSVMAIQRRQLGAEGPRYVLAGKAGIYVSPAALEDMTETSEIAFCEGAFDALSLGELDRRAGRDRIAVGVPGLGSWGQVSAIAAPLARGRRAYVATDNDPDKDGVQRGGNAPALLATWARDLRGAGALEVHRACPRGHHDWNAALCAGEERAA